jgi:hypothetical protein
VAEIFEQLQMGGRKALWRLWRGEVADNQRVIWGVIND